VVATAILDRLLHHSHVITLRGDSYRLKEKRRSGLLQKPHCSRNKIGEKSVSAARSTASRSLATALFEGALARGLLQIGKHQGVSSSCRPGASSGCRLTELG
jgi:IstB-like ATP binding protein